MNFSIRGIYCRHGQNFRAEIPALKIAESGPTPEDALIGIRSKLQSYSTENLQFSFEILEGNYFTIKSSNPAEFERILTDFLLDKV